MGVAAEINQLSFSRLLSHWKRRFSTVLQKENALFILIHLLMFFLPLIGSNQTANLIWVKFSTWRAFIALDWLSLYSNSYFVLSVCSVHDIKLFTFHIIKTHYSFDLRRPGST